MYLLFSDMLSSEMRERFPL